VTSVSGRDSSTSTGRMTALTRPKTSAVSSSQKTPRTSIPGTSCVAAQSAKAVMKVRAQNPIVPSPRIAGPSIGSPAIRTRMERA
jgi:hypothetical protein